MSVILKCFNLTLREGREIHVYSEHDLTSAENDIRSSVALEQISGRAGLGTSGIVTYGGRSLLKEIIPTERVTSHCNLEDVDRILNAHREARRIIEKNIDSTLQA